MGECRPVEKVRHLGETEKYVAFPHEDMFGEVW